MNYHLRPTGKTCRATGEPLAPGERCWSVLVLREGKTERWDYSAAAWEGPPEGAVGYWQSVVPGDSQQERPLDPDELMALFEHLCEDASPATERTRYALALHLLRLRRLEIEETRTAADDDEHEAWLVVVGSRSEGPFEVRDLKLPEQEIRELQASFASAAAQSDSTLRKAA